MTRDERRARNLLAQKKFFATPKGQAARRRMREKHGARNAREHRARVRAHLHKLKSVPCVDCGGTFPPCCMDFDHRPGETKLFDVSDNITRGHAALMAEVAKCDIVCANCHRIRTDSRGYAGKSSRPFREQPQLALELEDPRIRQVEVRGLLKLKMGSRDGELGAAVLEAAGEKETDV